jgi:hypothetical protein
MFIKFDTVCSSRFSIAPNLALIEDTFSIAPSTTAIAELAPACVATLTFEIAESDPAPVAKYWVVPVLTTEKLLELLRTI